MSYKVNSRSVLLPEYGPIIFCRECSHSVDFSGELRAVASKRLNHRPLRVDDLLNMYVCSVCGSKKIWFRFKRDKILPSGRDLPDINWSENSSVDDRWFTNRASTHNDYFYDPDYDDYVFLNNTEELDSD